jgi:hypothetical protein
MLQETLAITFIGALTWSCASAPAKAPAPTPASQKSAPTVSAPAPDTSLNPSLASTSENHHELRAGECEESFDCVDTVGFPAAGQRWTCVNGKCGRAKLPDLDPAGSSTAEEATADASKDQPTAKKARKRHN